MELYDVPCFQFFRTLCPFFFFNGHSIQYSVKCSVCQYCNPLTCKLFLFVIIFSFEEEDGFVFSKLAALLCLSMSSSVLRFKELKLPNPVCFLCHFDFHPPKGKVGSSERIHTGSLWL